MTTLALSFILIMMGLVAVNKQRSAKVQEVINDITEARSSLIDGLKSVTQQMEQDIARNGCDDVRWDVIEERNAIRVTFRTGSGWFIEGDDELVPRGKECLKYFSRLWLKTLYEKKQFRNQLEQLVVEGHTNSNPVRVIKRASGGIKTVEPYLGNLELSQRRAFNTVQFILENMKPDGYTQSDSVQNEWPQYVEWQRKLLTATGRSSSELVLNDQKQEDTERSKRIEFKFILKHDYARYKELSE